MSSDTEDFIAHFGVKGMRWGVTKSRSGRSGSSDSSGGSRKSAAITKPGRQSADASRAAKLKKKDINSMSNDQLKQLNNRINLEKQYRQLTEKKSVMAKGKAHVDSVLDYANTANRVYNLATSPMVKAVGGVILEGVKKAKR